MENNNPSSSSRTDRKTIERNRRNQMKALYSKLNSLVPHQTSREAMSLPDQLDDAANYIKKLQTKLEKMREKKDSLKLGVERTSSSTTSMMNSSTGAAMGLRSPQIEIDEVGSSLQIVLITGLDSQFMFNETIRVLHEEGADIVHANFYVREDTVFHTIHSEIGDSNPNNGGARISQKLKNIIQDYNAF